MKEYLERFTAGMDERKTAYQHWIVLEEHGTFLTTLRRLDSTRYSIKLFRFRHVLKTVCLTL
jgi:hypothetical protein